MPRLFIAVWPPPTVVELLDALPRPAVPGVRWTTPAQLHVTLRYLGEVDESLARAALEAVVAAPAEASLGPTVGRLGPDTVIVPVGGLEPIAGAVELATLRLGERPHPDGFVGHLTLGRQRGGGRTALDGVAVASSFTVDEIALVRSERSPDGARYTTVARRSLAL